MPWAMPPRIWPSTTAGLMSAPQSSVATYRSTPTSPVSDVHLDDGAVAAACPPPPSNWLRLRGGVDVGTEPARRGLPGHLADRDRGIGIAADDHLAVGDLEVAGAGFEEGRRDVEDLGLQLPGAIQGGAAGHGGPPAAARKPEGDGLAVAVSLSGPRGQPRPDHGSRVPIREYPGRPSLGGSAVSGRCRWIRAPVYAPARPPMPSAIPVGQSGATDPVVMDRQDQEGDDARH